ncbi:hypothetical protein P152DRAFT_491214 [Eremomyces bilateralis CBS 781.70]|uniref:Uncharacterized protein n=1 Tax=Eremomyces bilateralis CBS 781.70 TaxID=1392243 RepID=A0A6G1FX56_9PEZI|nr:uncharacterized protein P152DRAFT_491214 [Eremomyces bilateralis CBS 781.70]KAF1810328.1 hypothetical protein P152DRAFT_491214 [Eremomyces bilateralis CBS 781.70]
MSYEEDEYWRYTTAGRGYGHVPPRPTYNYLNPAAHHGMASHHRSRSQGAPPAPNIQIHNITAQEDYHHERAPSPNYGYRGRIPVRDDAVADELADIRRELRGRSRGRESDTVNVVNQASSAQAANANAWREWEYRRSEARAQMDRELELAKKTKDLEAVEKANRRKQILLESQAKDLEEEEERKAAIAKYKAQEAQEEEDRKAAVARYKAKEAQEKEDRKAAMAKFRQQEADEKREREEGATRAVREYEEEQRRRQKEKDEWRLKLKLEEEEAKRKEKEEEERLLAKLKAKEEEKKREEKEAEAKLTEEMHKRLAKFGFQENQIEAMVDPSKAEKLQLGQGPKAPRYGLHNHAHNHNHTTTITSSTALITKEKPTFIKVKRKDLSIDTLKYYQIPWEYDTDSDFIILKQELDSEETDILFEHTRRLRGGNTKLLIETSDRSKKPEYAFVRRRGTSRSRSRSRVRESSPKRVHVLGGMW